MELENYFSFLGEKVIRIKGTRVGIENVIESYLEGSSPEELLLRYPTVSLEQIDATITYYLANCGKVEAYIERVREEQEAGWQEQQANPSKFVVSLRKRLEQQRLILSQHPLPVSLATHK
ncbi:MAG: DUF433 domain-containing protein [Chloroflexota bacterium]